MFKITMSVLLTIIIAGCGSSPFANDEKTEQPPSGQWILTDQTLNQQTDKFEEKSQEILTTTMQVCYDAALDAPIPKPKCRNTALITCVGISNYGSCSNLRNRACDIISTKKYDDAILALVKNCMAGSGWHWVELESVSVEP